MGDILSKTIELHHYTEKKVSIKDFDSDLFITSIQSF